MLRKKLLYVLRVGGGEVVLPCRLAEALDSRLRLAEGGVRGREFVPETDLERSVWEQYGDAGRMYRESNLRMSACEYDAPIIFLFS